MNRENNALVKECCVCKGDCTLFASGTAYLNINKKEYRVYYHKACLTEQAKPLVANILNEMVKKEHPQS